MARILIIDDEEIVRDSVREMLQMGGHEVEGAADGQAGIDRYRENPADLVIADIMMPKKSGLEIIEELRRDYPDAKIIAMAAYGEEILAKARALGADRTFDKPFHLQEMLDAVNALLEENGDGR